MFRLAIRKKFLTVRVVTCSNRLPSVDVDVQNLEVFKARVNGTLSTWLGDGGTR